MKLERRKEPTPKEKEILYRTFSENSDILPESELFNEYLNSDDPINLIEFRSTYTDYSFPILTHEFITDIKEKINPKGVVDLACGPGWLSFWLMKYGIDVKDSVDLIDDGGFANMKFSESKINITKMDVIDYLIDYNNKDDLLVLSWPPYESSLARRVFETMENGQLLLYIGEGMNGCTVDDDFHKIIKDRILETKIHLDNFFAMHDRCFLIKK